MTKQRLFHVSSTSITLFENTRKSRIVVKFKVGKMFHSFPLLTSSSHAIEKSLNHSSSHFQCGSRWKDSFGSDFVPSCELQGGRSVVIICFGYNNQAYSGHHDRVTNYPKGTEWQEEYKTHYKSEVACSLEHLKLFLVALINLEIMGTQNLGYLRGGLHHSVIKFKLFSLHGVGGYVTSN